MIYQTPDNFYCKLHHPRPRFKNDIENVLGYIASSIVSIGKDSEEIFRRNLNREIKGFGKNATSTEKTINNWRTEISALFSLFQTSKNECFPTPIALNLANDLNLENFFLSFIYSFQYPASHLKPHDSLRLVSENILFHPGRFIAQLLLELECFDKSEGFIQDTEFCHCALNDLRVTRDNECPRDTVFRIIKNRQNNCTYKPKELNVSHGDTKRYALDILDYMYHAGLLIKGMEGKFAINSASRHEVQKLANTSHIFEDFSHCVNTAEIDGLKSDWIDYVNSFADVSMTYLQSDSIASDLLNSSQQVAEDKISTKSIGDIGEDLVLVHEVTRLRNAGKPNLARIVSKIPTHLAIGYDIKSHNAHNENPIHIEVKTTKSQKPLDLFRFHLTSNEWRTAEAHQDNYFVFRLQLTENNKPPEEFLVINNPVGMYKKGKISMTPRDGADISFQKNVSTSTKLLTA